MPKVFIDNIEVTNILDIGEISDQLSPNGSSFNITLLAVLNLIKLKYISEQLRLSSNSKQLCTVPFNCNLNFFRVKC